MIAKLRMFWWRMRLKQTPTVEELVDQLIHVGELKPGDRKDAIEAFHLHQAHKALIAYGEALAPKHSCQHR